MKDKSKSNMLLAFILNLSFTIIELIGGILTNSISILSDAIHDFGDSISIGISLILEKVAKKKPDDKYTYGYLRYSVLGAIINLCVLLVGTTIVLFNAIPRLLNPEQVNYDGMLFLAILGLIVNGIGVLKTIKTDKISEKVISLHLLEDVLGWAMVLVVSIFIKIFNLQILDPILSLCISVFILYNVIKNAKKILDIILEKSPSNISIDVIKEKVKDIKGVQGIHHIHLWTLDGVQNYLTAHIVVKETLSFNDIEKIKSEIKHELEHLDIEHTTIEIETGKCEDMNCDPVLETNHHHMHEH